MLNDGRSRREHVVEYIVCLAAFVAAAVLVVLGLVGLLVVLSRV